MLAHEPAGAAAGGQLACRPNPAPLAASVPRLLVDRSPRSSRREPYGAVSLGEHDLLPFISDTTLDCIVSALLWANPTRRGVLRSSAQACGGLGRRIRAGTGARVIHVLLTPL